MDFILSYSNSDEHRMDGNDYEVFLGFCSRYCATFSFCIYPDDSCCTKTTDRWKEYLTAYRIPKPAQCVDETEGQPCKRIWFPCSRETVEALRRFEKSVFNLMDICGYNNPFSIQFERPDGSVLAYCHADDEICWVEPEPGEDISPLLQNIHWIRHCSDARSEEN